MLRNTFVMREKLTEKETHRKIVSRRCLQYQHVPLRRKVSESESEIVRGREKPFLNETKEKFYFGSYNEQEHAHIRSISV